MAIIRRNVLANITGRAWAALLSLAFVPIYIRFLGVEAYGLIGFYLTLYGVLSLLDLGLGTTLNRELAQLSVQRGQGQRMRDLLRTLEIVYWLVGLVAGISIAVLAPAISRHWINSESIPRETVEQAVLLMGIAIACQWPLVLYTGGLMGLQRHVLLNGILGVMATLRSVGAVLVLWTVSATIEAFLAWQLAVSLIESLIYGVALWRSLPPVGVFPRFRFPLALSVWRFSAGTAGISAMAVILTQMDKVILSNVLPLSAFGYYTLASRVASVVYYVVNPVIATFFPRFSQLFAIGDQNELGRIYHLACQFMSVLTLPLAIVVSLYSFELMFLWMQDRTIATHTHVIVSLLVAGTAINALMSLPGVLQLACGWTGLGLIVTAISTVLLVPLIFFMSLNFGGVGAAGTWVLLNVASLLVVPYFMHRRLLPTSLWRWYRLDIGMPLIAALAVAGMWKWLIPAPDGVLPMFAFLVPVLLTTLAAAIIAAPDIRPLILRLLASNR